MADLSESERHISNIIWVLDLEKSNLYQIKTDFEKGFGP